jgi:hypothetical protein
MLIVCCRVKVGGCCSIANQECITGFNFVQLPGLNT